MPGCAGSLHKMALSVIHCFSFLTVSSVVSVVFWKGSQVRGNICSTLKSLTAVLMC